jgi:superfamily II DNA or RNA helicase
MVAVSSNPQGSITVQGSKAIVRFRYSEERFKAIKRIGGARFDKEHKVWTIPLGNLPALAEMPEFNAQYVTYNFDTEAVAKQIGAQNAALESALKRMSANPFAVSQADIETANPDIVFTINEHGMLRASLGRKSRAKKYLEGAAEVHYVRKERAYAFPTQALNDFLKLLRDRKIRFAVEASAGERLKRGSLLRAHLAERPGAGNSAELIEALLYPILDLNPDKSGTLRLFGWTTEQLRECFPEISSFADKKSRVARLSGLQAAEVLYKARSKGISVWLTREAKTMLDGFVLRHKKDFAVGGFDENLLALSVPELCWVRALDGGGGLLAAKEWAKANLPASSPLLTDSALALDSRFPEHKLFKWRDSQLLAAYTRFIDQPSAPEMPCSGSFLSLIADLRKRGEQRAKRDTYHKMKDCKLELADSALTASLFPHQRIAVRWLLDNRHGILGDDMGLGKTLSVLAAAQELKAKNLIGHFLVVCPNSLVRNWLREGSQWTRGLRLITLPGEKKDRQQFLRTLGHSPHFDGRIVNYETARLEYVYPELKAIFSSSPSLLCIDESQRIKNPQSKAFEAMNDLAEVFERRVLLTGTPTPRDLSDIWGQMMIVDRGERFGKKYYDWLPTVAELGNKYSDMAIRKYIPEQVEETILRVHEILLRRSKEEVINLPEKLFSVRDVELTGDQGKRYREVCDELLVRVSALNGRDYVRSIDSILEQYLRAVQIASNPRLVDPQWMGDPAKFLELDQIVAEIVSGQKGKLVIWTNYLKNVEELVERFSSLGAAPFSGQVDAATRQEYVQKFQDLKSGLNILVAVPGAGGVGITLTAAQTAVYLDKTWNAEHWMQSVDRIHRIGQTGTVNIISLHGSKVDDLIAANLRRKERNQAKLLKGIETKEEELHPSLQELIEALQN